MEPFNWDMDLIKSGLLFRLSSHSNLSPMEGKTFQEGMNALSEEASLEEIFELMKV